MNLIFMRHGESTDNVKELISDKEIYWSTLTEQGKAVVLDSINSLPAKIDKIYISPFPRTIQTAHYVYEKFPESNYIIENRIREINNGKYSGKMNNEDQDNTRNKQIAGDYFIRFGEYGENKYDIELRLCEFLKDVVENNFQHNTIMIVSHGSITSYMKRILQLKTSHIKTGKIEIFNDVDFKYLYKHINLLKRIKSKVIKERKNQIKLLNVSSNIKLLLNKLVKKEFNNIEFSDDVFKNIIAGYSTSNLVITKDQNFDNSPILVCFYNNCEEIGKKWIEHYIKIGIKNFVLVDNNSSDNTRDIFHKYDNLINIAYWKIDEKYNCYKMCSWKQLIFEHYGHRKYITVDSDELLIYKNFEDTNFEDFIDSNNIKILKGMMLDVYPNKPIFKGDIDDFNYIDKDSYKISSTSPYGQRFYGGPRSRLFSINPSLQKIPFINYSGKELYINDHFYYPFNLNYKAKFCSYLLHYKFLPGDYKKFKEYAKDGRHWNNSKEYKTYINNIVKNNRLTFYSKDHSININDIKYTFKI